MATQASSAIAIPIPDSTKCCGSRAYLVPPIAVLVDVGLPLLLLTTFAVTFRFDHFHYNLPLVLFALRPLLSGSGGTFMALLGHKRLVSVELVCVLSTCSRIACMLCRMRRAMASKKQTVESTDEDTHIAPFTTVEVLSENVADTMQEVLTEHRPSYLWLLDFAFVSKMRGMLQLRHSA